MSQALPIHRLLIVSVSAIIAFAIALVLYQLPVAAGSFDNMFQTLNAHVDCNDEGSSTPPDTTGHLCQTDNSTLTYYSYSSISVIGRTRISSSLNNDFDSTDLNVSYDSTPSFSGGSETDIIYDQRNDVPSGHIGVTWCDDAVSYLQCDQQYVAFLYDTPGTKLVCHESGHAVGLTHGVDAYPSQPNDAPSLGCMQDPIDSTTPTTLGSHNEGQINATY